MSVAPDQLRLLISDHPDEVAYRVVGDGAMTFAEWGRAANRLARGLIGHGVKPGDRVVIALDPGRDALRHLQLYVAVHKAGAVNVAVDPQASTDELARVVDHADPSVVVASPAGLNTARKVSRGEQLVVTSDRPTAGIHSWSDLLATDDRDVQVPVGPDDLADVVYTSGTTGVPKGVAVRHRNALLLPLGDADWTGLRWFHASPLFTTAGHAFAYVPMQLGMTGVYQPRFDPAGFADLVEGGEVDMAFLVPAMVELLLTSGELEHRDLSGLQLVAVGAAPSAPESLLTLDERLPNASVLNAFALTESGAAWVMMPAEELRERPASVGKPIPPAEIRVVDEDGSDLPPGRVGEILLRNPGRQREYYRDPEATRRTWQDGWLHTGDFGRLDADGYLYVVGRRKDVIIRGGHNVHAADVEVVLSAHPKVATAAVVGITHRVLGEEVAAAVVPVPGADDLTAGELERWCADRLARHKTPRHVTFVEQLPRNAAGKVDKAALQVRLESRHEPDRPSPRPVGQAPG